MQKTALMSALVALALLGPVGPTAAQDDSGGSTDSGAATTPDAPSTGASAATPPADQTAAAPADDNAPAVDDGTASDPAAVSAAQSQLTWNKEYLQAQAEKAEGLKDLVAAVSAIKGQNGTAADVAAVAAAEARIKAGNDAIAALNANRPKR